MSPAVEKLETNAAAPPSASMAGPGDDLLDSVPWLPCTLTLEVPVVHFTIADLLALKEGAIVETACGQTSDVPLRVNGVLVGWTEFDVVGEHLAVRITEQA